VGDEAASDALVADADGTADAACRVLSRPQELSREGTPLVPRSAPLLIRSDGESVGVEVQSDPSVAEAGVIADDGACRLHALSREATPDVPRSAPPLSPPLLAGREGESAGDEVASDDLVAEADGAADPAHRVLPRPQELSREGINDGPRSAPPLPSPALIGCEGESVGDELGSGALVAEADGTPNAACRVLS